MSKKEAMDLLLSKIPADKKDAFVKELRAAKDRKERNAVIKKYGAELSEEEAKTIRDAVKNAVSDEELDAAAGGCCDCGCNAGCNGP
jgi:methylase of polypeptide subunit release factors